MRVTQAAASGIHSFSQAQGWDSHATKTQGHTTSYSHSSSPAIKFGISYHSHVNRGHDLHSITSEHQPAVRAHRGGLLSLDSLTLPGRLCCFPENRDKNQMCDALELVSLGEYSVCEQKCDPKQKMVHN